jgi:tetratricopeptide (TPR) repeat protein
VDERIARARDLERRASLAQREGRFADADAPLLEAIAIWTALNGDDDIEVLNCRMNLGVAYRRRGDFEKAVALLEDVIAGLSRSTDVDAPGLLLMGRNNLATALRFAGRLDRAREMWTECLHAHGDRRTEERARVLDNLAMVHRDLGDYARSEELARRGLADWRAMRGDDDRDTATAMAAVGAAVMDQGRLDEAATILDEALRVAESASHELDVASALTLVGFTAYRRGDRTKARTSFERALTLTRRYRNDDHPEVREILESLAHLSER